MELNRDLVQRRLNTLLRLLRAAAETEAFSASRSDELTPGEMLEWAQQTEVIAMGRSIQPAAPFNAPKPAEDTSWLD